MESDCLCFSVNCYTPLDVHVRTTDVRLLPLQTSHKQQHLAHDGSCASSRIQLCTSTTGIYIALQSTALIVTLAWQMQCLRVNNGEAILLCLCVCVCYCAHEVVRIMVDTFNCGPAAAFTHTHTQWAVQWWVETKKASIKQPKPQMLFDVNRTENKTEIAEKREVLLIALWLGNKIK